MTTDATQMPNVSAMKTEISDSDLKPGQRVFAHLGESILSGKYILAKSNGIFVTHHMMLDYGPVLSLGGDLPEENPTWYVNETPIPSNNAELMAKARQKLSW